MTGLEMKYFVLKPHGNDLHAKASRAAMLAYAEAIKEENHDLFLDLVKWVAKEEFSSENSKQEMGDSHEA